MRTHTHIHPDIPKQVGAPMFADQRFMDATAARLNQRNIVYVGDGAGGSWDEYRVGDPIPVRVCLFVGRRGARMYDKWARVCVWLASRRLVD